MNQRNEDREKTESHVDRFFSSDNLARDVRSLDAEFPSTVDEASISDKTSHDLASEIFENEPEVDFSSAPQNIDEKLVETESARSVSPSISIYVMAFAWTACLLGLGYVALVSGFLVPNIEWLAPLALVAFVFPIALIFSIGSIAARNRESLRLTQSLMTQVNQLSEVSLSDNLTKVGDDVQGEMHELSNKVETVIANSSGLLAQVQDELQSLENSYLGHETRISTLVGQIQSERKLHEEMISEYEAFLSDDQATRESTVREISRFFEETISSVEKVNEQAIEELGKVRQSISECGDEINEMSRGALVDSFSTEIVPRAAELFEQLSTSGETSVAKMQEISDKFELSFTEGVEKLSGQLEQTAIQAASDVEVGLTGISDRIDAQIERVTSRVTELESSVNTAADNFAEQTDKFAQTNSDNLEKLFSQSKDDLEKSREDMKVELVRSVDELSKELDESVQTSRNSLGEAVLTVRSLVSDAGGEVLAQITSVGDSVTSKLDDTNTSVASKLEGSILIYREMIEEANSTTQENVQQLVDRLIDEVGDKITNSTKSLSGEALEAIRGETEQLALGLAEASKGSIQEFDRISSQVSEHLAQAIGHYGEQLGLQGTGVSTQLGEMALQMSSKFEDNVSQIKGEFILSGDELRNAMHESTRQAVDAIKESSEESREAIVGQSRMVCTVMEQLGDNTVQSVGKTVESSTNRIAEVLENELLAFGKASDEICVAATSSSKEKVDQLVGEFDGYSEHLNQVYGSTFELLTENRTALVELLGGYIEQITGAANSTVAEINDRVTAVVDSEELLLSQLATFNAQFDSRVAITKENMEQATQDLSEASVEKARDLIDDLAQAQQEILKAVSDYNNNVLEHIGDSMEQSTAGVDATVEKAEQAMSHNMLRLEGLVTEQFASELNRATDVVTEASKKVSTDLGRVRDEMEFVGASTGRLLETKSEEIEGAAKSLVADVDRVMATKIQETSVTMKTRQDELSTLLGNFKSDVNQSLDDDIGSVAGKIDSLAEKLDEDVVSKVVGISAGLSIIVDDISHNISTLEVKFVEGADKIKKFGETMHSDIYSGAQEASSNLESVTTNLDNSIVALGRGLLAAQDQVVSLGDRVDVSINEVKHLYDEARQFNEESAQQFSSHGDVLRDTAQQLNEQSAELFGVVERNIGLLSDAVSQSNIDVDAVRGQVDERSKELVDLSGGLRQHAEYLGEAVEQAASKVENGLIEMRQQVDRVVAEVSAESSDAVAKNAQSLLEISAATEKEFSAATARFSEESRHLESTVGNMSRSVTDAREKIMVMLTDLPKAARSSAADVQQIYQTQTDALNVMEQTLRNSSASFDSISTPPSTGTMMVGHFDRATKNREKSSGRAESYQTQREPVSIRRERSTEGSSKTKTVDQKLGRMISKMSGGFTAKFADALDARAAADFWKRRIDGEDLSFGDDLYTATGERLFAEVEHSYGVDESFRESIDRFIDDFDALLVELEGKGDRDALLSALTSDAGLIYTLLFHASSD